MEFVIQLELETTVSIELTLALRCGGASTSINPDAARR
jgi:hypothetical protein